MIGTDIAEIWIGFVVLVFLVVFSSALSIDDRVTTSILYAMIGVALLIAIGATIGLSIGALQPW